MFRGWIHIFLVKWLLPPTETYFGGQNIFAIRWQLTPDYNLGRWQSLGKDAWQDSQGTSTPGNNLQGRNCMIIQNVQIVHLPKQTYHKIFAQWMLIFDTCRVVTMVIFGGSVLHHALNAQQFIYSYAPHKPTSLSRCCQELPWRYRFLAWLLTFFYTLIQPHFQVDATSRQRHLLAMDQGCLAQSQATGDSVLHGAHYHR